MKSESLNATRLIRVSAKNPEAEFDAFLQRSSRDNGGDVLLAVDFEFCEYWRDDKPNVGLTALFRGRADKYTIAVLRTAEFEIALNSRDGNIDAVASLLNALPVAFLALDTAMPLQPISIPKPWGQEIWYTGIEKRGVAEIGERGRSVPLPWLLAAAPQRLSGGVQQPILLKILDPLPEPVFGDLYFELHRQKQEVYVVTAVDQSAWPDGVGAIRFGFDAKYRDEYGDDREFVQAYLKSVRHYRAVRKRIDAQLDTLRARDGIGLNDPVSADTLRAWLDEIDADVRADEAALRAAMESFTSLLPLRIGDVVKVPCLLPHSLQHGVRTVEFQTPVYERLILSFAQKVLTQSDWDTDEAATVLQLDPDPVAPLPVTAQGAGWREEQIVIFDDFEVRRLTLDAGAAMQLELKRSYGLAIVVGQPLWIDGRQFSADAATLLPSELDAIRLHNDSDCAGFLLLALPLN